MYTTAYDSTFYKNKKILLTGHTGFKGSWLSVILANAGAQLTGYSLCSEKEYSLFEMTGVKEQIDHIKGDVRDIEYLKEVFCTVQPEIVIHMAAQPIVRESYANPVYTYETNVLGTLNILECVRLNPCVKSFLNVTTDKVYENKEWVWGYRENEPLDGYDPYSNSKSCSELITHSYKNSFFNNLLEDDGTVLKTAISTARAGNVIGGGDFSKDRIIPDCVRSIISGKDIIVRNPYSVRPYQHVLEALNAYLMIVSAQYEDSDYSGWYNVGPDEKDCCKTEDLVNMFVESWNRDHDNDSPNRIKWVNGYDGGPYESNFLKLDCSKIKSTVEWTPCWSIETAVKKTVEWTKCWIDGGNVRECMNRQIEEFEKTRRYK